MKLMLRARSVQCRVVLGVQLCLICISTGENDVMCVSSWGSSGDNYVCSRVPEPENAVDSILIIHAYFVNITDIWTSTCSFILLITASSIFLPGNFTGY